MLELLSFKHEKPTASLQKLLKSSGTLANICDLMHNELLTASFADTFNGNPSPLVNCTQKVKQILEEQKTNAEFKEYFIQDLIKRAKESIDKMLESFE